jgi:FtsP/CotA-like multicopper oxidase with cupredoxin domain
MKRRHFLTIGGAAAGSAVLFPLTRAVLADAQEPLPHPHGHVGPKAGASLATAGVRVEPFAATMPVPPVLRPVTTRSDTDVYRQDITPANVGILPGLTTPALTYGGSFVGPTIRATSGRRVLITYRNVTTEPVNVHLHGGRVAAQHDGYPMDVIEPGGTRTYEYLNQQPGATLWYHDHGHHLEATHVYHGLHGFYVIDDPLEQSLRLPDGQYDVPIMLRDALFESTGELFGDGDPAERTTFLANGKPVPRFPVAARKYRFRLLNAANERNFRLTLNGAELVQIGTDGGLLPAPLRRTELELSSGERADVVVDFARYPVGTQLVLADATGGPVLRFDVVRTAADTSRVPDRLRTLPALPPATVTREVTLGFGADETGFPQGRVNDKPFDPNRVDFQVRHGTTEIWRVVNNDPIDHNFHLHMTQFRVLDRGGDPALPQDAGRKDTIVVPAGRSVRVQATFAGFLGKYVYHCHFLEHSSLGMMAQLEIVP